VERLATDKATGNLRSASLGGLERSCICARACDGRSGSTLASGKKPRGQRFEKEE
jgi:hypothetical protein